MTAPEVDVERGARRASAPAPELLGFDHLEWWVGNARHAAHFLAAGFGFAVTAYAGPETGRRDRQSFVLEQGDVRFVVTSPLEDRSEIARHVLRHGDGVHAIAYRVADARAAHTRVVARGGRTVSPPAAHRDGDGEAVLSSIAAYGDTVHTLVERDRYRGAFLPGYRRAALPVHVGRPVGLVGIDHVVANVEEGRLRTWVGWYERVWGLSARQHFTEDAISTEYSALRSTVVGDGDRVVQPINEPAAGRRPSQIAEFLDYYDGPGVQHVALRTSDIVATVSSLRERGVRTLSVPAGYYEDARRRMEGLDAELPWRDLARLGILVDRDPHGYLLQVFTEPVASRPTAFVEIIQREGAAGFGEGNFKALFTAIEAEQARRGNL